MSEKSPSGSQNVAYPDELRRAEDDLLALRRSRAQVPADSPRVGFALSGGGIRSATFSLGMFQALAQLGLIGRIDYLSTVSGGGYFGAFLGRLFGRWRLDPVGRIRTPANVEALLDPDRIDSSQPGPVRWLRLSSRYLTPNGNGDMLMTFAILLRNWVALQIVTVSFMLMVFVVAQLLRVGMEGWQLSSQLHPLSSWLDLHAPALWWSPYLDPLVPIVVLGIVPAGWAFWIADRFGRRGQLHPLWGLLTTLLLSGAGLVLAVPAGVAKACMALLVVGTLTLALYVAVGLVLPRLLPSLKNSAEAGTGTDQEDYLNHYVRQQLTRIMSLATGLGFGVLLFGFVDTVGQSLYVLWFGDFGAYIASIGSSAALLTPVLIRLTRLPSLLGSQKAGAEFRIPVGLVAWPMAAVIALTVTGGVAALSHAAAWGFKKPPGVELVVSAPAAKHAAAAAGPRPARSDIAAVRAAAVHADPGDLACLGASFGVLLLFSLLFGRTWPFVNRSSLHAFYKMRLTRAYLGASNRQRLHPQGTASVSVADAIPGDDQSMEKYAGYSCIHGGPLHLINVTLNETAGEGGKTVLRDRKGTGMAFGPRGLSVGVQHHALLVTSNEDPDFGKRTLAGRLNAFVGQLRGQSELVSDARAAEDDALPQLRTAVRPIFADGQRSSVFGRRTAKSEEGLIHPDLLSLGHWTAISGAAVSTGLGSMSSIPLSYLLGFSNVRLGYWWHSGVDMSVRRGISLTLGRRLGRVLRWAFPVQQYLLDEFTSTFHGAEDPRWYLTDGGHFENMGAYELIRRRLPLIVIVDGEADPDYACGGLANLVRKARMDFGAEIEFLDAKGIASGVHEKLADVLGPLGSLCPDEKGISTARAALARVSYGDKANPDSWLLYIKATLTGREPADLREYRISNPGFPQQSTADQFFDETQWECYRRLGEQIGTEIFGVTKDSPSPFGIFMPGNAAAPPAAG